MAKPKKTYEELTDEEKAKYDKWQGRADRFNSTGQGMQKAGGKMAGCGCLLTIVVTIPIILIVIFFLL